MVLTLDTVSVSKFCATRGQLTSGQQLASPACTDVKTLPAKTLPASCPFCCCCSCCCSLQLQNDRCLGWAGTVGGSDPNNPNATFTIYKNETCSENRR